MSATHANPVAQAYRRNLSGKQQEAQVFQHVVRGLRAADGPISATRARADARRLWTVVRDIVLDGENQLPPELRAQLASVSMAMLRECDAEEPDMALLADVTEDVAGGLWS